MKQYLVVTDQMGMNRLQMLLGRDVTFLEVQGMDITGNPNFRILSTPIAPVEAQKPLEEAT